MSYVGNPLATAFAPRVKQDLTGQSGTSFTLSHAVSSANDLSVYINHVRQEPTTAYTVDYTTLTTTGSVASTDDFYIIFDELALQSIAHDEFTAMKATSGTFTGAITTTQLASSGPISGTTGTFSGDISLSDNAKAKFGASNDLEIYHDSSHSYIKDTGTGSLKIETGNYGAIHLQNASGETMGYFEGKGEVKLYHNNNLKFETTSAGIDVTGDATITSTDDDATADPSLILYRNSASPASGDTLGELTFRGRNDNSQDVNYSKILARTGAITDGSENGKLFLHVMNQGTLQERLVFRGNERTRFSNKDVELSTGVDLVFEGATANANETTLTVTDPTADRTITLPDVTGTVITTGNTSSITSVGTLGTLKIGSNTVGSTTDLELTDNSVIKASSSLNLNATSHNFYVHTSGASTGGTGSSTSVMGIDANGDLALSRNEANGTVRLNLSNTGSNGSTEYSEIKLNSTAGGTQTSVVQHRNNYGLNIGTTTDHPVYFLQNNSNAMSIDTSGRVGIGTTSPSTKLHVSGSGGNYIATFQNTTSGTPYGVIIKEPSSAGAGYPSLAITNHDGSATRFRIDSSTGHVGIGRPPTANDTVHILDTAPFIKLEETSSGGSKMLQLGVTTAGTPSINAPQSGGIIDVNLTGVHIARFHSQGVIGQSHSSSAVFPLQSKCLGASNSASHSLYLMQQTNHYDTTSMYIQGSFYGSGTNYNRFLVYSNGSVYNTTNTYGQISDERLKSNITDAKSQWDDIKNIKVRNFKKYDTSDTVQIGVVAQELEKVSPNLIEETAPSEADIKHDSVFGTVYKDGDDIPEDKEVGNVKEVKEKVKGVKYSVLHMKAIKALQEAMERIEILEAKVKALENK